jgi:elongation factor 1-alpha
MASNKPHMNMVVIGHVDHGKSTLVGRILLDTGQFPAHEIERFKKEAEEKGKGSFYLAWVMDNLKEERERGVTIDVSHKKFDTQKYYFTIIDAPGHRDFVKNMITGTSQADCAILTVSAIEGIQAQTKEHVFLSRTLGIRQLIVALNKVDATKPAYNEQVVKSVSDEVTKLLKSVGFTDAQFKIVPVSAWVGDNIKDASKNMPWYKGPTLISAMDTFQVPAKPTDKPLRLPIQDVYSITGIGTVPVGRIECGILKPGDNVIFEPSHKTAEVKSIEMHHEMIPRAEPGDNVGFNCRGIAKNDVRRGDVAGPTNNPPTVAKTFTAQIMVLNHPSVIAAGYTPVFHAYTAQVACTFEELLEKLDPKTGQAKETNPQFLKTGDAAKVRIRPSRPMVIEKAKEIPELGRFAIRDMGQTVAAGVCIDIEPRKAE